jgi:hypothetical protein
MKPLLGIAAWDTDQAVAQPPDVSRMFNGRAASYADIDAGFTFGRTPRRKLADALQRDAQFISLVGAAGVGKTTLARQLLLAARRAGSYCWEHVSDFPLDADGWLDVETQLRARDAQGVLMVDDCTRFLTPLNRLVNELATRDGPHLRLVLTATRSAWRPRLKARHLFGPRAVLEELSVLTDTEIDHLVNLATAEPAVGALVQPEFALLTRGAQVQQLRLRARADMFVCLKNVFATEELDNILLQEYAELSEDQQAVYLGVAAIQAICGRAHRQLVLRLLDIRADQVADLLGNLSGIVDEYAIWEREGLYGWETRHPVIAEIITRYKYSSQDDLYRFLEDVIEHTNPTVRVELGAILEMCNADYAEVGLAMAELNGDTTVLDEALTQMAAAVEDAVPDPALRESLDALRRRRERLPQEPRSDTSLRSDN